MWNKFKATKWFIPVLVAVIVGIIGTTLVLALGWASKTIPATGTVNVTTTTTTPPPPDLSYTLSPNISFGATTFACGAPVTITGTVTVANTGNQPIGSFSVALAHFPSWITAVTITQIPVPVGASVLETVTLTGTAPSTPGLTNFVTADAINTGGVTITPGS
jgi:hypothetical protein